MKVAVFFDADEYLDAANRLGFTEDEIRELKTGIASGKPTPCPDQQLPALPLLENHGCSAGVWNVPDKGFVVFVIDRVIPFGLLITAYADPNELGTVTQSEWRNFDYYLVGRVKKARKERD